ncbi:uncharacterized protein ColSpa_11861 [Colletotrichum spaethianum]|uniref:Uncharacterized protein n=1 Tax=Colletotrichum spaethianum TaxID=700344 RepID=A0AA37PG45_9PEZI|nr:uncharacterized protein ColSpa_11861 [Colletotrichum spaethianum]GKT51680.1 hypothetical protein ColSpa_11861 [Colletotrichum spaethianum]
MATKRVKHRRRSHQRGMHNGGDILDDCTSDSDSGESPSTPKHANMQQPPQLQSNDALNHPSNDPGSERQQYLARLNERNDRNFQNKAAKLEGARASSGC